MPGSGRGAEGRGIDIGKQLDTNCEAAKAVSTAENILTSSPDLDAFFGACGAAILGAQQAMKTANQTDIVTVGYDGLEGELKSIAAGKQDATVVQFPEEMARAGVEAARKVLRSEELESEVLIRTALVTKDNVEEFMP